MITTSKFPFDIINYPDGRHLLIQVDATDKEVAEKIEKHKGDPLWEIRYKCHK